MSGNFVFLQLPAGLLEVVRVESNGNERASPPAFSSVLPKDTLTTPFPLASPTGLIPASPLFSNVVCPIKDFDTLPVASYTDSEALGIAGGFSQEQSSILKCLTFFMNDFSIKWIGSL